VVWQADRDNIVLHHFLHDLRSSAASFAHALYAFLSRIMILFLFTKLQPAFGMPSAA
jgi:hypothetical protein